LWCSVLWLPAGDLQCCRGTCWVRLQGTLATNIKKIRRCHNP
jgi:hypothetical protein